MTEEIFNQKKGKNLIVLGASTRAAAFSALRAGLVPWCIDLFADHDLCKVAQVKSLAMSNYPTGLVTAVDEAPAGPWLYTGALENRPRIVRAIADKLSLWGNGPEILCRVRSPFLVARSLQKVGLPYPLVRTSPPKGFDCRKWLRKPRSGAGGSGIHFWKREEVISPFPRGSHYFQEWIEGWAGSAHFLGMARNGGLFLGVTRQLIGEPWLHAAPFRYCGSLGPLPVTEAQRQVFVQLGLTLIRNFGLRGLFGVDFVMHENLPWPVEVNPRYTASVEILEYSFQISLLALHQAVFERQKTRDEGRESRVENAFIAKAILFADRPLVFPGQGPWQKTLDRPWDPWTLPEFADVPREGQAIAPGQPILTFFSRGTTEKECWELLRWKGRELNRCLFDS